MTEKYAGAARAATPPAEPLPAMSCDCHLHVFGDPAKFPDRNPNPVHASREASWEDLRRMHAAVGFTRGVLVQPANYTTDHSYIERALARLPEGRYRAIGIMDDSVTEAELERLHAAGMRVVRFNFVPMFKMVPSPRLLQRSIDRIRRTSRFSSAPKSSPIRSRRCAPSVRFRW
jgi:predicted TIM-barrel fold metal-dependent hydrolase